ncbi:MAG TPA: hypothetical protein VF571_05045 [Pyrinomonadaceae bacterium]|jgi:hypothetical protein
MKQITELKTVRIAFDLNLTDLIASDVSLFFISLEAAFKKHPNGFARHCEPRKDQEKLYGLSWTETLDLSRYAVKKTFLKIGVHHKSRQKYEQAPDKFQGKYYCSVYDASDHHRTFYYRNHDLFNELTQQWLEKFELAEIKPSKEVSLTK